MSQCRGDIYTASVASNLASWSYRVSAKWLKDRGSAPSGASPSIAPAFSRGLGKFEGVKIVGSQGRGCNACVGVGLPPCH